MKLLLIQDQDDKDDEDGQKVEDCLTVTALQGGATTERRRSQVCGCRCQR